MAKNKNHDEKSKKDLEDDEDNEQEGTKDVSELLENLDEGWEDTEETDFGELDTGKYKVKIVAASLGVSKKGRPQVTFELDLAEGKYKGRKQWKRFQLDDEGSRGRFRGALAKLGQSWPKKPSKIPSVLEELEETYAEISVRENKNGGDPWVDFTKAIDADDIEESADDDDDEKPAKKKGKSDDDGKALKKANKVIEDEDDDEDEKPAKKGKKVVEEEDDDEDEKPAKKKAKAEPEENEDDEEEKPAKKSKAKADDDEDGEKTSVTLKFEEDDLEKADLKKIAKLADKHDFDPEDYKTKLDLIADIAEYVGVSGKFKTFDSLAEAIDGAGSEEE